MPGPVFMKIRRQRPPAAMIGRVFTAAPWGIKLLFILFASSCFVLKASTTSITTPTGTISSCYSSSSAAIWNLSPSVSASRIQIIFQSIYIQYSQLRVYDTGTVNTYLLNCVGCGSQTPPPFYSTTGYVTVELDAGTVASSTDCFKIQYIAESQSVTNFTAILNYGYGKITPQLYDGSLQAGSYQVWKITQPLRGTLIFSFSDFLLASSQCVSSSVSSGVSIKIYDALTGGNVLYSGCSEPPKWLYSTTGYARVVVSSVTSTVNTAMSLIITYSSDADLYNCGWDYQPDTMNDVSMVIRDGSYSSNPMRKGQNCQWLITPEQSGTTTLIFDWVSLFPGSSVVVYDNSQASGTVLWNGQGPTTTTPPPLTTSGKSMYIVYASGQSTYTSYKGFKGEFLTNYDGSRGLGSGVSTLSMSSAIDITPPGDGSSEYTKGVNYTWNIAPTASSGAITFMFSLLELTNTGDVLYLFNGITTNTTAKGNLIAKFTGSSLGTATPNTWYYSSLSSATVIFESSATSTTNGNLKFSFYSDGPNYLCGFSSNPASLTASSYTFTDGTSSTSQISGNQYCKWIISPRDSSGMVIYFSRFSVKGGYVKIYSGSGTAGSSSLLFTITNTYYAPAPLYIDSGTITVVYATNSTAYGTGFAATYYGVSNDYLGPGSGLIKLASPATYSIVLKPSGSTGVGNITANSSLLWVIKPSSSTGSMYLSFSYLHLPAGGGYLSVYDGAFTSASSLSSSYLLWSSKTSALSSRWIQSSSTSVTLRYVSDRQITRDDQNFEVSYFSDGNGYHCGLASNPTTLTAPSMAISDGSISTSTMLPGQLCEWIISPYNSTTSPSSSTSHVVVLEFMRSDLTGGDIDVYDGTDTTGSLLWHCSYCKVVPGPIISISSSLYVRFSSGANSSTSSLGKGFEATYWTTSTDYWRNISDHVSLLEFPKAIAMDASFAINDTYSWKLGASSEASVLTFFPRLVMEDTTGQFNNYVSDGRPTSGSAFASPSALGSHRTCGSFMGASSVSRPYLSDESTVRYLAQRSMDSYLWSSSVSYKYLYDITGSWDTTTTISSTALLIPSSRCKYFVDLSSRLGVEISITTFEGGLSGQLLIYGGVLGTDDLLYDSHAIQIQTSSSSSTSGESSTLQTVVAPCGKATIIVVANSSYNFNTTVGVDYGFELSYQTLPSELTMAATCNAYIAGLSPAGTGIKDLTTLYYGLAGAGGLIIISAIVCAFLKYVPSQLFTCTGTAAYMKITPHHPRYTPRADAIRNRFLPRGTCCVCKEAPVKVFTLPCKHTLCREDIDGYLETALGDISMFPVKCPMHFEGCPGTITPVVAKRVLSRAMYDRFLDFLDRALYGEGMRCIYCNNYVTFPEEGTASMVECPYCIQRFCMRCKRPWHYGEKCPLDNVDDTLEQWKSTSGAQRCPACHKLIEKDDPDTCNHMVHKITDGIPCVRDRTDFCYLCGEEVTGDYPHDEVRNPGVNHFPDGVFQKCRYITLKEREAERDRLRKLRRMKQKNAAKRRAAGTTVVPTVGGSDWESDTDSLFARPTTAGALALNFVPEVGGGGAAAAGVIDENNNAAPGGANNIPSSPRRAPAVDTAALFANVPGGIAGLAMGFDHAWDVEMQNQQAHNALVNAVQLQQNNNNAATAASAATNSGSNSNNTGGGAAGAAGDASGGHHLIRARAMYVQRK